MKKPVYCFLDDSAFELSLMRDIIAAKVPGIEFACFFTFEECREFLEGNRTYPSLFILDLYGADCEPDESLIPPEKEIIERAGKIRNIKDIYDGLDGYNGNEKVQEFLKRLFSVVNDWRDLHSDVFKAMGHSTKYGIGNYALVKRFYPLSAALFYTRKSTIHDAVEVMKLGADGLFLKPSGTGRDSIEEVTLRDGGELISAWHDTVRIKYISLLEKRSREIVLDNNANPVPGWDFEGLLRKLYDNEAVFPEEFVSDCKVWLEFYDKNIAKNC